MLCGAAIVLLSPLPASAELTEQQYVILTRVLQHGLGEDCRELVIEDQTTAGAFVLNGPETPLSEAAELIGVDLTLLLDWQKANKEFDYLAKKFALDCEYVLISTEDREKLFATAADDEPERGWRNFRREYAAAAGIIRMSKPVIAPGQQQALAYIEFDCGPSCGSGRFVTLEKVSSKDWHVNGGSLVWMAAE